MRVFFFCYPQGPPEAAGYEHQLVSLAEGFDLLDVNYSGNINYWTSDGKRYLITFDETIDFRESDIVVFSSTIIDYDRWDLLPSDLFSENRSYKLVFMDCSDGFKTPGFRKEMRQVDYVFKAHFNHKYKYPENFIPWQFGLTNRIIESMVHNTHEKKKEILVNYRVDHMLRKRGWERLKNELPPEIRPNFKVDKDDLGNFNKKDLLYWQQTGARHYPKYYNRLCTAVASMAFGGHLDSKLKSDYGLVSKVFNRLESYLPNIKYDRVYQYDSWRFWESLAAGSCTIHLDFEKYGALLPIMPKNGQDYIGVDLDSSIDRNHPIKNFNQMKEIGLQGKLWVLENYSPIKISERFLERLS